MFSLVSIVNKNIYQKKIKENFVLSMVCISIGAKLSSILFPFRELFGHLGKTPTLDWRALVELHPPNIGKLRG